jgi:adenosylcobinamide-GDP ribazoletransferase
MREALSFLTVLGRPTAPTPRALRWFPLVGVVVGALVGGTWWLAEQAFPVFVAAVLAVAADAVITGMLHFDGLADSADGLLPHLPRERRLGVMRTPDVGTFGIVAVGLVLVARVAALTARPADIALIAGLWCASRTVAAVAPAWIPYARDEGLATAMLATRAAGWPALALLPAGALAVLAIGAPGIAATAGVVLGATAVLLVARHKLGGFTGDVLGAAIVVGETVGLIVASARW